MSMKNKARGIGLDFASRHVLLKKWPYFLCFVCFCAGMLFANRTLAKRILDLQKRLAAVMIGRESASSSSRVAVKENKLEATSKIKYLVVVGINTQLLLAENEEIRFVQLGFHKKNHVEGFELLDKTKSYLSTAVSLWGTEFYIKVDDDIHVNLAALDATLVRHRTKLRVYISCMKIGPVLSKKRVKYHEPEYLRFGNDENNYFRHATGQLDVLLKYANEDGSLGSWFVGLDVEQVDDKKLCCGTPPDCETKALGGEVCVASFDWKCSGICDSVERMSEVHQKCAENKTSLSSARF